MKRELVIQENKIGCADNSCVFGPPGGMGTNGGCQCESRELRHGVRLLRAELASLRREFSTALIEFFGEELRPALGDAMKKRDL